ncbi:DJ-1/PfpI family protein [Niallia sp. 01092]|uniref:DJ-1/PfpI family protein n=1 Tax=unclassified Niallia TaxID=2837522 RepID=UPI003FD60A74
MSKKALLIIPPERFNEVELFAPKAELENNGIDVTIASTKTGIITGDYNGKVEAAAVFSDVSASDYDVIAVIGGSGTIDHLWGDNTLLTYLKDAYAQKILIAGICAGSVSVVKTGLLSGRKATCYPVDVMINELKANTVDYVAEHVVVHKDIITSNGPDGAEQFGKSLVAAFSL